VLYPGAVRTKPAACLLRASNGGKENTVNVDTVKTIPLFASVSKRQYDKLAGLADEVVVPAGLELTREGGYAREFFVVVDGTADVFRGGERVGTLGPGDFFGELGLLQTAWLRTATVVATSPMRLLVVGRGEFRTMIETLPAVAEPILRAAAERA
jgi:CRP-like cAMP-binding protein